MRSIGSFRRLVFHGLVFTDTTEIGTAIRPLRRAPIPMAFALAVLATAAPEQAAAQTVTTLVSNTGGTSTTASDLSRATAFTTGTGTYTLSSVGVYLDSNSSVVSVIYPC